jgi:hypothetical protein
MASTYRSKLLSSTMVPMLVGVALVGASISGSEANPMAQPRPGATQLAQACGACNPCDPCAAANPCNPCAAGAGAAYVMACAVPRLMAAATNPCNPCNPCGAALIRAAANPCNPCAAANPCAVAALANPCAAANPCNPCAAANPCAVKAVANPCAAANPCNPCAAANPCAVAALANPCNPCAAANPCNPCGAANPCAAAGAVKLTNAEAGAAWDCMMPNLEAAYSKSGHPSAMAFADWSAFGTVAYASGTHGNRYVQNLANGIAKVAYGKYEDVGKAPAGSQIAKPSIVVTGNGEVGVGPLFLMEKMRENFNNPSGDWRYTMIMPDGTIFGETLGQGTANVQFCADCHGAVAASQDNLFFLPKEVRVMAN